MQTLGNMVHERYILRETIIGKLNSCRQIKEFSHLLVCLLVCLMKKTLTQTGWSRFQTERDTDKHRNWQICPTLVGRIKPGLRGDQLFCAGQGIKKGIHFIHRQNSVGEALLYSWQDKREDTKEMFTCCFRWSLCPCRITKGAQLIQHVTFCRMWATRKPLCRWCLLLHSDTSASLFLNKSRF